MAPTRKRCSNCQDILARDKFNLTDGGKQLKKNCRDCCKELKRLLSEQRRIRAYGVESQDVVKLREIQADRCAICQKTANLKIDHNHSTGQLRGLLCHKCNTGLGLFDDDPKLLTLAISYLENE